MRNISGTGMKTDGLARLPVVIIPAYQSAENLIGIVDKLLCKTYPLVVVVNDGSSSDKASFLMPSLRGNAWWC